MTDEQIQILRHTLGADAKRPGYRNHYCAGDGDAVPDCEALVTMGLMRLARDVPELGGKTYCATARGIALVLKPADIKRMERDR
jgi:hypothetical protein